MKKRLITLAFAVCTCVFLGLIFISVKNVRSLTCTAQGCSAGDDEKTGTTNCTHYCTAWGASWHKQTLAEFERHDDTGGAAAGMNKENMLKECRDAQATEIYRFSYEYFTKAPGSGGTIVEGKFKGLSNITSSVYTPTSSSESGVETKHEIASRAYGLSTQYNQTSWFCYNPKWECTNPPGDPEFCCRQNNTCPRPQPTSYNGEFYSTSSVSVVGGGDIPGGVSADSEKDGTATIKISTDQPTVTLNFTHKMYYINGVPFGTNDTVDNTSSPWKIISSTGDNTGAAPGPASGTFTTRKDLPEVTYGISGENHTQIKYSPSMLEQDTSGRVVSQVVNYQKTIAVGSSARVCYTLKYDRKFVQLNGTTVTKGYTISHAPSPATYDTSTTPPTKTSDGNPHGRDNHGGRLTYTAYTTAYLDDGNQSTACATIVRPSIEDSGDGTGGVGSTASNVMYTGEDASVSWSMFGTNAETRRLNAFQTIVFNYAMPVGYSTSLHTGSRGAQYGNQPADACSWYGGRGGYNCTILDSGGGRSYNESRAIVVPNEVGVKYCNSSAYQYQYWWYSSSSGWHADKTYWRVFDAACRTIAKKPSTAFWNSSFMTSGGARFTPAYRYDDATMGRTASGSRTLFGTWSEFLDVIGRSASGIASGSSLFLGSTRNGSGDICNNDIRYSNSPLTIANTDCARLGNSGITNNSTLLTRLRTYLKDKTGWLPNSGVMTVGSVNDLYDVRTNTKTKILRVDGDLTIERDIAIPDTTLYNSIYQIPQIVIFVSGNVHIKGGVKRIDAWLIAGGTVNTCDGFVESRGAPGGTEARGICSNQLTFNGPVIANKLNLRRTYGADGGSRESKAAPGEIFNLRADVYLWAHAQAGRYDSSYTEAYTRELAPRY